MPRPVLLVFLAALTLSIPTFAALPRPNVLLILADDLGFSDPGCYGGEIETPHLDRLAKNGVRFSAFYNSARCCPSRASLMTGLHPHQAGIGSFANRRPRKGWGRAYTGHLLPICATLAEMLADDGYSTWMVGKWHMGTPGPIARGFQNYYGYRNFLAHSENQWNPDHYIRLPEGTDPERSYEDKEFYVTDVFSDYAVEFLQQARQRRHGGKRQPWFLYLAHSSPHFPIQAPRETIEKYVPIFRKGWDRLREERFERQKALGLVPKDAQLPPRSEVPVDHDDIANGFSGVPNPAWESLDPARREDLARRGATFAAMVEHVDRGIGRLIADLATHGELANTLILFTSDNGACYEWGPFGFDGPSRQGLTVLHRGDDLKKIGQDGTHQSYGSGWANLGNTPLNMYKHFCHEGGIASPLIVHWPEGIAPKNMWVHEPAHIMDVVPTVLAATGARYPEERAGQKITPVEGLSLLPALSGKALPERTLAFEHQGARGLRRGPWKLVWGKRQPDPVHWELYDLEADRSEQTDLSAMKPELTQQLAAEWKRWAKRVGAEPFQMPGTGPVYNAATASSFPQHPTPEIANRALTIDVDLEPVGRNGVVVAQGGREQGYALHLLNGHLAFDVRINGAVTRIKSERLLQERARVTARLAPERMTITVDGKEVARGNSPGLIPVQPKDPLDVGRDELTAAGNYDAPNPLRGTIHSLQVRTE